MSEVEEVEILEPEVIEVGSYRVPPAAYQEAIAGNALLEIKHSLDAVWLYGNEVSLPREQSLISTYKIARHYLEEAFAQLGSHSPEAYTPSVRGWIGIADQTLHALELIGDGTPNHENPVHLSQISEVLVRFMELGHKMLLQKTTNKERRGMKGLKLAESFLKQLQLEQAKEEAQVHG